MPNWIRCQSKSSKHKNESKFKKKTKISFLLNRFCWEFLNRKEAEPQDVDEVVTAKLEGKKTTPMIGVQSNLTSFT